ncbi:MAG: sigma-70 family RNA polymerase sigma factor [Planctomycetota bacterium]
MEMRSPLDAQALLANAGWMRTLASRLLEDDSAADDVVQDATVAALRHAPEDEAGLAPWLSRVVRNFAYRKRRDDARRARREEFAAEPRAEPSPTEVAERLELQRMLVDLVSALDEPFRRTIVLRYFESRSCVEIAELYGIPEGTVRWRSMRGLELLRKELDARAGSRMQWSAMLMTFTEQFGAMPAATVAAAASSKVLLGVSAMKAVHAAAAGIAAVILGGLAWWGFQQMREEPRVAAAPAPPAKVAVETPSVQPEVAPKVGAETALEAGAREAVAGTSIAPAAITLPPPPADRFAFVDARFVDAVGTPWSGVRLLPIAPTSNPYWNPGESALSGTDGSVLLQIPLPKRPNGLGKQQREVKVELVASRAGCTSVARTATVREGETSHLGYITLGPGVRILGRAMDADGKGVAGARLGIAPALLEGDEGQMRRHGSPSFQTTPGTSSASDGGFTLEGVAPGKLRIWAHSEGFRHAWSQPLDVSQGSDLLGISIVMSPFLPTDFIMGQVVDPAGVPLANISVQHQENRPIYGSGSSLSTDENGHFELLVDHDDATYDFTATDFLERFGSQTARGVKPGARDVVIRMLAREQFAVRVRDPDGVPVENARFEVTIGGMTRHFVSTSTSPGDYSIARPEGGFWFIASAPGFRTSRLGHPRKPLEPAQLPTGLDVILQRSKLLQGRVTADGAPVVGADVYIVPDHFGDPGTVDGYRFRYVIMSGEKKAITDAEGHYQLDCDTDSGYDLDLGFWLRAVAEGWAAAEVGPVPAADLEPVTEFDFELTHGGVIEGRVLLPDGKDAEGAIVSFNHGDGFPKTLRAGKGGVFRIDGLTTGKWQVQSATHEISPDRTEYANAPTDAPLEWSCEVQAGVTTHFDLDLTKQ